MFGKTRFVVRLPRTVLLLALALLGAGCGSKGTVSGKVFYQGKPLPGGGRVTFLQEKGAFNSVIGEDGSYRVTGLLPGSATITVSSPDPPQPAKESPMEKAAAGKSKLTPEMVEGMKHMGDPEAGKRKYVAIPSQYKDPEKSGLTCTVQGGSQNFDIQLK